MPTITAANSPLGKSKHAESPVKPLFLKPKKAGNKINPHGAFIADPNETAFLTMGR